MYVWDRCLEKSSIFVLSFKLCRKVSGIPQSLETNTSVTCKIANDKYVRRENMAKYRIVKNRSELLPPRIEGFAEAWQECDMLNAQAKNCDFYEVITDP